MSLNVPSVSEVAPPAEMATVRAHAAQAVALRDQAEAHMSAYVREYRQATAQTIRIVRAIQDARRGDSLARARAALDMVAGA